MSRKAQQKDHLPRRQPGKHQLDKWERQREWQRITVIASAAVIGALLIFVAIGFYQDEIGPRRQPAVAVDDTIFDLGYYTNTLATYAIGQDTDAVMALTNLVAREIQQGELIRRGAAAMGITADGGDVTKMIESLKLPDSRENRDLVTTQILINKLRSDYFGLQVPASADHVNAQVMFLESPKAAEQIRAELQQGADFAAIAKGQSLNVATREKGGELGWLLRELINDLLGSEVVANAAFKLEKGTLSQPLPDEVAKKVGYWLLHVYDRDPGGGAVKVKVMLLGSQDEALAIRARLLAGEDFTKLASQYSQDAASKDKGGDLGVLPIEIVGPLRNAAITIPVDQISDPIRVDNVETRGGAWLVKLIDKETDRKLDDETRNKLIDKALDKWLQGLTEKATLENLLSPDKLQWALDHLPKSRTK